MTQIDLEGVALRTHDESYTFDVDPYAHQIQVRQLIQEEDRFVAVNDSPTGGGKTSSWLEPVFEDQRDVIAIYPTNALVADQHESILNRVEDVEHEVAVLRVTADRLAEKRDDFNANSHGAVLEKWLTVERRQTDQRILLTNPDIFVMLRRDLYRKPSRNYKDFELTVVDEFHRAGKKEQNTLRYILDEMQAEDDAVIALRQVTFLSATPDEQQERLFESAFEAPYFRVAEERANEQRNFTTPPDDNWRGVMPPVELDVRTAPTFGTAEQLIEDKKETLAFCRGGRTVVMLDGIHEVGQIYSWLEEEIDGQVERIDGFYGENKKDKLDRFDVLVSNSAVEVGIDFEVDRILFAGHARDSFFQRLGRLRSETEWRRARCYVPSSIADILAKYDDETLTRQSLDLILTDAYPKPQEPQTFDVRYSAAEAFEHLRNRLYNAPSDDQETIRQSSLNRIERHFGVGHNTDFSLQDMKRFTDAVDIRVLSKLQWYRGDNIQALVYDRTNERLTTYNLFYLLRYGDIEFFERDEFERIVPRNDRDKINRHERYVDAFCIYDGTIETNQDGFGRDVYFTGGVLNNWISNSSDTGRSPQLKTGLKIGVDPNGTGSRVQSITKVNDRLRSRDKRTNDGDGGLLCYPVSGHTQQVKRQYNLGDFFFLYPIRVQSQDIHSLAIGTDALYLHCHVLEQNERLAGGTDSDTFLDDL